MNHDTEHLWFAQTRLHPPLPPPDALDRPRLLDALYTAVTTRRLTLLAAPAGAGKTTLLAALTQAHLDLRLAWLALARVSAGDLYPA